MRNFRVSLGLFLAVCLWFAGVRTAGAAVIGDTRMDNCVSLDVPPSCDKFAVSLIARPVLVFPGDPVEITATAQNLQVGDQNRVYFFAVRFTFTGPNRPTEVKWYKGEGIGNDALVDYNVAVRAVFRSRTTKEFPIFNHVHQTIEDLNVAVDIFGDGSYQGVFGPVECIQCSRQVIRFRTTTGGAVKVPAGTVEIGRAEGESGAQFWEQPAHCADVNTFFIDLHEVTNEQYMDFVNANGYYTQNYWHPAGWQWRIDNNLTCPLNWEVRGSDPKYLHHPVTGVSWYEADAYVSWKGRRLPTETEWEKAAQNGNGWRYPWGDGTPGGFSGDVTSRSHCQGLTNLEFCYGSVGPKDTMTIGQFATYPKYYLNDMIGNAWEWCSDWFSPGYYAEVNSPDCVAGPKGPCATNDWDAERDCLKATNIQGKVVRGGSYRSNTAQVINSGFRQVLPPTTRSNDVGFRTVSSN